MWTPSRGERSSTVKLALLLAIPPTVTTADPVIAPERRFLATSLRAGAAGRMTQSPKSDVRPLLCEKINLEAGLSRSELSGKSGVRQG
jgi:hypothetical protein